MGKSRYDYLLKAERLVICYTNRERRKRGLIPLRFNKKLYNAAKYWSRIQAKNKRIMHGDVRSRLRRFGYKQSYVGENCAMVPNTHNPKKLAASLIRTWMNSPSHRSNILDSNFNEIGVGLWVRGKMVYATQDFGHKKSEFHDLIFFGYYIARTLAFWILILLLFGLVALALNKFVGVRI